MREEKLCRKCDTLKATSEFYRNKARDDGLSVYCRPCHNSYQRDMEARKAIDSEWVEGRTEKRRARDLAWYARTRDRRVKLKQKSREQNRESDRAAAKKWRTENPEAYKAAIVNSKKKKPEKYKEIRSRRRARELRQLGSNPPDIPFMLQQQEGLCYYCQISLSIAGYNLEHKIPLSKGGLHDASNVCLSCPPCNAEKATLTAEEFLLKKGNVDDGRLENPGSSHI